METTKSVAIGILVLVMTIGGWSYYQAWHDAEQKIVDARTNLEKLQAANEALTSQISNLTEQQTEKDTLILVNRIKIANYERDIATLKQNLVVANQKVAVETDDQSIAQGFKAAYELTNNNVKLLVVPEMVESGKVFKNLFLALPIDLIKPMIAAKNSEVACRQEIGLMDKIGELNAHILTLTNEKLQLEREKTQAWQSGYKEAYDMYIEINGLYLTLLKAPPKAALGLNWFQILAGLASGALICSL